MTALALPPSMPAVTSMLYFLKHQHDKEILLSHEFVADQGACHEVWNALDTAPDDELDDPQQRHRCPAVSSMTKNLGGSIDNVLSACFPEKAVYSQSMEKAFMPLHHARTLQSTVIQPAYTKNPSLRLSSTTHVLARRHHLLLHLQTHHAMCQPH